MNEFTDSVCNWILELQSNCNPSLSVEPKVMMKCVGLWRFVVVVIGLNEGSQSQSGNPQYQQ